MGFDWTGSSGSGREKFHFAYLWLSQELCWNSGLHLNLRDYSEGRPRESAVENTKTRWVLTGTDVRRLGSDWEERSEREPGPQSPDRSQLSIRLEFGSSEPEPGWDGRRWGMGRGSRFWGYLLFIVVKTGELELPDCTRSPLWVSLLPSQTPAF